MVRSMTPRCESCGTSWRKHLGIQGTCAKLREAEREIERLRAELVETQTQADVDVIDARDAAWNLFTKRVNRRRAKKIWPWLAEYEAAEKARGE